MLNQSTRVNRQLEFFRQPPNFITGLSEIECNRAAGFSAQHNVLGYSHRVDQHKVLVDHTNSQRNSIMRRFDLMDMTINQNFTFIRLVESISDPHRSGFPGPVFPNDGVNRARLHDNIHVVVSENVSEPFGYVS